MRKMRTWMKGLLFVLAAAIMVFGVRTVTALAEAPTAKPANFKVVNQNNDEQATFTWDNPWENYSEAKDDDAKGGVIIERSEDGGKSWETVFIFGNYEAATSEKLSKKSAVVSGMEHGKTYSFRIFYYNGESDRPEAGSKVTSSPASIKWTTKKGQEADKAAAQTSDVKAKFAAKGKVTYSGGYSEDKDLAKGMKVVFDRGAYKLTAEVLKATTLMQWDGNHRFYTIKYSLQSRVGKKLTVSIYTDKKNETIFWDNAEALNKTAQVDSDCKSSIGAHSIRIHIELSSPKAERDEYLDFVTIPGVESLTIGVPLENMHIPLAESTKNSVKLTSLTEGEKEIQYRKKGTKKWQTKKTDAEGYTIKKLKANTVYEVRYRLVGKITEGRKSSVHTSEWSNTLRIRTAIKSKPKATLKISGAKYKKWKNKGYWRWTGAKLEWHDPSYSSSTGFKLKVKMKKTKGMVGFVVEIDGMRQYVKGKSKTLSFTVGGNKVGKKIKVKIASMTNKTNTNTGTGISPFRTYKVLVK